jgi:hypothetical protein
MNSSRAYRLGVILSVLLLISVIVIGLTITWLYIPSLQPQIPSELPRGSSGPGPAENIAAVAIGISFLTFVISAIGTASTIILGWRSERRQAEESKLRIAQLEIQLAEVKAKIGEA